MRTVDPKPAQVASMDKSTVLRLLALMTGGTMLKRGAEVEAGVSRWAWSLLARLPERGELTSEEIGIVRELGKRAVLIGMGLRENQNWEEGMKEVEKDFDEEDHDELAEIVNKDEIELDSEEDEAILKDIEADPELSATELLSGSTFIGPKLIAPDEEHVNGVGASAHDGEEDRDMKYTSEEEGELLSEDLSEDSEALAVARARILARLDQEQTNDSDAEDLEAKIQQEKLERESKTWNTKATIDMIITVAGEVYGQRDLLEFRGAWEE